MNQSNVLAEVQELTWDKQCTFIGSLEAALKFLGEDTDYIELMGMSGAAFRIQFDSVEWSTSCVDMFSRNESADFLGYYLEKYWILNRDGTVSTPKEEVLEIIKNDIDAGNPVIGLNLLNAPDWGIIAGYDGDDLLVRDYHEKKGMKKIEGYVLAKRFPNIIFRVRKNKFRQDKLESMKKSLIYSVRRFKLKKIFDQFANGFSAYNIWMKGLSDDELFSKMDKKTYEEYWLVNGLMYSNLYDARHSAHLFLEGLSDMIDDDNIQEVAAYYEDLEKVIWDNWIYFPLPFFIKKGENRISIPDGRYIKGDRWSSEMRKNGYKSLRLIKRMEYRAFKRLERAVSKWDSTNTTFFDTKTNEPKKGVI